MSMFWTPLCLPKWQLLLKSECQMKRVPATRSETCVDHCAAFEAPLLRVMSACQPGDNPDHSAVHICMTITVYYKKLANK